MSFLMKSDEYLIVKRYATEAVRYWLERPHLEEWHERGW